MPNTNLYIEPVDHGQGRKSFRVVYRHVEIKQFARLDQAVQFKSSIEEAVR